MTVLSDILGEEAPFHPAESERRGGSAAALDVWLAQEEIDKDVYLAVKVHKINQPFKKRFRNFERLYESAGFVFFVRKSNAVLRAKNSIEQKASTDGY